MRLLVAAAIVVFVCAVGTAATPAASPAGATESADVSIGASAQRASSAHARGLAARASSVLKTIASSGRVELGAYLTDNRAAITTALSVPGASRTVSGWWRALPSAQQSMLSTQAPRLIGNLDGIPFRVRGELNREALSAARKSLGEQLGQAGASASAKLAARLTALTHLRDAMTPQRGDAPRTLMTFDPDGSMRAAIAIGDIDSADDVSFLVPGMFYTVGGQMQDWTAIAQDQYRQQLAWLDRLGETNASVAVVAWLGYRTPDLESVLGLADARAGATLLESALAGVRAVRGEHQPYLSVLAHSYGSTTAMIALQSKRVTVDALAVVGSPGSPVTSAKDLAVRNVNVFVGAALFDPVAASGFLGTNPAAEHYSSKPLGVLGCVDPIDGRLLLPAIGHNGYFAPGTESMRNLALIAIGAGFLVV